ncbi:MAG TPA: 3' terminal RNA ribose 2'-O-methyltransferase Hen1 [Chthoniobacteraceae bacterium]|jgi:3' terminal RNA ribose 2'-O-methyltransferase Hen1|nr:3' terminal RNA ribose 2'-O-methyltransferase Hen1 [Chthoniobacteraceae bacterium]
MLFSLSTTHYPATDLGFLLRKNPARAQTFELPFGEARVFYPEASEAGCTCVLQVVVDPIQLVRKRGDAAALDQYVNDRPYAASSFLSVAIARVFDSALAGRAKERLDLVDTPLPLVATISALPCGGDGSLLRRLFEPLGYAIKASRCALDATFPEWGESRYHRVELAATRPLRAMLSHLYVLIPVLDGDKHYWVGDAEVEKLLRHGEGWLAAHPERELIARRYLKHRRSLVDDAIARLGDLPASDDPAEQVGISEDLLEAPLSLHDQRLGTVLAALKASGAASVLDLGCGEGRLLRLLLGEKQFTRITGMDVSHRALEIAADRLNLDRLPPKQRERLTLLHGSLMYRDARLAGHDAAAVVEVIEHLDPPRLAAFERVLFECARPGTVILTTPNRDYNALFPTLPAGHLRHRDHRFEWTRAEFAAWCDRIGARFGYSARILPVGPEDPAHGAPSQMGIFEKKFA